MATVDERTKRLLEETFDGIREGTNPVPIGVSVLMGITILTAFLVTFPLWGQRIQLTRDYWLVSYVHPLGGEPRDRIFTSLTEEEQRVVWALLTPRDRERFIRRFGEAKVAHLRGAENMMVDEATKQALIQKMLQMRLIIPKSHESPDRNQPWWDKGYLLTALYTTAFLVWTSAVIVRTPVHPDF